MLVTSAMLTDAAEAIRASERPRRLADEPGIEVSAAQMDTAARILREAEPSQITSMRGAVSGSLSFDPQERPGFIDGSQQDDSQVLTFVVGIIPSHTYRIARNGEVIE